MNNLVNIKFIIFIGGLSLAIPLIGFAHQSGCHRWHSCPSDSGSYVCGDLGYPCQYDTYSSGGSSYDSYSLPDNSYPSTYSYPSIPDCPLNSYYNNLSSSCECYSGYVASGGQCVSADSYCWGKYGYNAKYNILSDSCECRSGYSFSGGTCVSNDQLCRDQLGLFSSYNSLNDKCECSYGYVISGGKCTDGDNICHSQHGFYSSYDDLSNSCKCDDGYTFDDSNQCVKKQNNVYFTLEELDTDERRAIIRSDYDYRYHLISYNSGCYSSSFRRYLNNRIVVNLGIDFDLDTWDRIVLPDDNEVCDITRVERADSSTTLEPEEEEEVFYVIPQTPIVTPTQSVINNITLTPISKKVFQFNETKRENFEEKLSGSVNMRGALRKCPSTSECDVIQYLSAKTKVNIVGGYENKEWYQVTVTDIEPLLSGWVHSSVINISSVNRGEIKVKSAEDKEGELTALNDEKNEDTRWYKKLLRFFSRLFR